MDLQNFHDIFAIGIVEIPLHTTKDEYGQNELNFLLVKATSNGIPLLTPA